MALGVVRSKVVVLLLSIGFVKWGLCLALVLLCYSRLAIISLGKRELDCLLVSFEGKCSVSLPHSVIRFVCSV